MARILSVDYGMKRTGLAVTDPLQIIATGLATVETHKIWDYLKAYVARETVEKVIIGEPLNLDGTETDATRPVQMFIAKWKKNFPSIPVETVDERYTSKMATRAMIDMGLRKKDRRKKELIDEISATMMLQAYLEQR
jgi:putative Holliday junction resolvase